VPLDHAHLDLFYTLPPRPAAVLAGADCQGRQSFRVRARAHACMAGPLCFCCLERLLVCVNARAGLTLASHLRPSSMHCVRHVPDSLPHGLTVLHLLSVIALHMALHDRSSRSGPAAAHELGTRRVLPAFLCTHAAAPRASGRGAARRDAPGPARGPRYPVPQRVAPVRGVLPARGATGSCGGAVAWLLAISCLTWCRAQPCLPRPHAPV